MAIQDKSASHSCENDVCSLIRLSCERTVAYQLVPTGHGGGLAEALIAGVPRRQYKLSSLVLINAILSIYHFQLANEVVDELVDV